MVLEAPRLPGPGGRVLPLPEIVDLLDLHEHDPSRYPYLLESAADGTAQGRFDLLFAFPQTQFHLDRRFVLHDSGGDVSGGFLERLDQQWRAEAVAPGDAALPFTGGWFLMLGYELAAEVEPVLMLDGPQDQPIAFAARIPAVVARNRKSGHVWAIAEPGYEHLLEAVRDDARNATGATRQRTAARILGIREEPEEIYLDAVARAKRYIREGDIFQANLARTWRGEWDGEADAGTVYRRLRRSNPAPFAGLARWGDMAIISSSPERLLRLADGWAETRPIAGTRPRGATATADAALRRELIDHPKERAEHIMLIDLERNDLGRICEAGTVSVDEYMTLESYAHVHHIVSNIRGRARAGVTPGEAIRAVFPGGTITGCPKVRCMEIISELEVTPRGAYTGAMGYLGRDGRLDLNILIRTLVQHRDYFTLHAGAGIVADSRPVEELKETRAKAKGVLTALTGDEGSG